MRPAWQATHHDSPPQLEEGPRARTWLTRAANFVIAVSKVAAGATLRRTATPDESMILLPDVAATIEVGTRRIEAGPESLTLVPPGSSTVTAGGEGVIVRVFSARAADLAARAANASEYAAGAIGVAPLVPWPDPPGGFKVRHYRLADYGIAERNVCLRSTNLMINILAKRRTPRDVTKLSPHSHPDFEQASVVVQGTYVHHLRYPWTPDMTTWREDQHLTMGAPSVLIIPPSVIHTSRNIGGPGWLIDAFGPPRLDFSQQAGVVNNADEYPMPALAGPDDHASAMAAGAAHR